MEPIPTDRVAISIGPSLQTWAGTSRRGRYDSSMATTRVLKHIRHYQQGQEVPMIRQDSGASSRTRMIIFLHSSTSRRFSCAREGAE
jgi:hypothetical protein